MRKIFLVSALFLPLIVAHTAMADEPQQLTVKELLDFCHSTDEMIHNACKFYILGVTNGADQVDQFHYDGKEYSYRSEKRSFCIPQNSSSESLEILIKGMLAGQVELFPTDKESPASSAIIGIITKNYQCKAQ